MKRIWAALAITALVAGCSHVANKASGEVVGVLLGTSADGVYTLAADRFPGMAECQATEKQQVDAAVARQGPPPFDVVGLCIPESDLAKLAAAGVK